MRYRSPVHLKLWSHPAKPLRAVLADDQMRKQMSTSIRVVAEDVSSYNLQSREVEGYR
jgi:hypothetical protein